MQFIRHCRNDSSLEEDFLLFLVEICILKNGVYRDTINGRLDNNIELLH